MLLSDLVPGAAPVAVTGFAIDHRKVAPGAVFGAFAGARANGEDFIDAAVAAGAVAVVARPEASVHGAAHIADAVPRAAFARLAARFFAPFPPVTAAVTGTNGKTSTVELTRQLWTMAGHRAASVGTLGITVGDDRQLTGLTTPDVVTFLGTMGGLAREGVTHAAFEASSHGLDQHRTEGLPVRVAAFTNLSRDHLDYHGTMEAYFAAKLRLFTQVVEPGGHAIVWADDPAAQAVEAATNARDLQLCTVGRSGHEFRLKSTTPTRFGQRLEIDLFGGEWGTTLELPLIGAYQAANALVAAAIVWATEEKGSAHRYTDDVLKLLERVVPIRGRLERALVTPSGAGVYIDYAHTPDALAAAIAALRPHTPGRLILVFGAGGDRDQGKRGPMGAIAQAHADLAIVTDDNPRHEHPATIRASILLAASSAKEIGDRREAIAHALGLARAGDTVLIAGKGHETVQIVGDTAHPFDDVAVARELASA